MIRINIKKKRKSREAKSPSFGRGRCKIVLNTLETGETVKRGCGSVGLVPCDVGWRCLYCGNFLYHSDANLSALWFHFKIAREYWRPMNLQNVDFINGIPVTGPVDSLPRFLLGDLDETQPPKWFPYYILYDEKQFQEYLERQGVVA